MKNSARYAILDHAADEAALWDVPLGLSDHIDGELVETHRPMTVEDLRPELEGLLRSGHVEVYEMSDPSNRLLSLADALVVIADDRNWFSPLTLREDEGREIIYALVTTDAGDDELRSHISSAKDS
jgi:hypothetical protein